MELVESSVSLPFEYSAYDMSSGLNVAMKIYDVTTGTPSLVSTVGMSHVVNGTYVGYFTPSNNKTYLVNKMVYTTSGYTSPLDTYSPGSESFYATTFSGGGGGSSIIAPVLGAVYNPADDTLDIQTWLTDNGTLVTTPTSVSVTVRDKDGDTVLTLSSSDPSDQGIFDLEYSGASSALVPDNLYTAEASIVSSAVTYSAVTPLIVVDVTVRVFTPECLPVFIESSSPPAPQPPGDQPVNEKALGFPEACAFIVQFTGQPPTTTSFTEPVDENTQP